MYTRLSNNSLWFVLQPLQLSSAGLVVVVAGSLIVYFLDLLTEQRYTSTKIHLSFLFWLLFTVSRRSYDITRVHSPATQRFFLFLFSPVWLDHHDRLFFFSIYRRWLLHELLLHDWIFTISEAELLRSDDRNKNPVRKITFFEFRLIFSLLGFFFIVFFFIFTTCASIWFFIPNSMYRL